MTRDNGQPGLSLDGTTSVDEFSLQLKLAVGPGSTVAVVGPNGAGKSTLLNVLAGLKVLDSGRLECRGSVWDDPVNGVYVTPERRDIALVPQNALLFPHLSIIDNVAFGLRYRRSHLSRREQQAKAYETLEIAGLNRLANRKPHQVSGGQRQRAAIVRALLTEPGLLLLDEPLSNVDATNRHDLRQAIETLRPAGQIQMVVTHGHDHAATADHVVALHHGRITASGPPAEVAAATSLSWLRDLLAPVDHD